MVDVMIVCPCTGNTLAKLANSITDTAVTMAVKSHLRNSGPVVLALATNDALSGSAKNIGKLMNYKNIYFSDRIIPSNKFFNLVINQIYDKLKNCFEQENTLSNIKRLNKFYPKLSNGFYEFLQNYSDFGNRKNLKLKNQIIFDYKNKEDFYKSIISYISGMTDNFAIEIYNEIIRF